MTYSELFEKVLEAQECCGNEMNCFECPYQDSKWSNGKPYDCIIPLGEDIETLKNAMKELDQLREQRLADLEYERKKAIFGIYRIITPASLQRRRQVTYFVMEATKNGKSIRVRPGGASGLGTPEGTAGAEKDSRERV